MICPKCDTELADGASACKKCGLEAARMPDFVATREANVPEAVRAAWTAVTADWEDAKRHDALLQLVQLNGAFAWAAGQYRARVKAAPDDAIAGRQLDRLRKAAEVTLRASATVRPEKTAVAYRGTVLILALMVCTIVAGLIYAVVFRGGRS